MMEYSELVNQTLGKDVTLIYRQSPFYMNTWFYIGILCIIAIIIAAGWFYFQYNIKNRTNVIIHMPDRKRSLHSFKYFKGDTFKIKDGCKDKDGNPIEHIYNFRSECVELGYFGRYIEFLHGDLEPINFSSIKDANAPFDMKHFTKSMTSYLNSETLSMLLIIGKLKDLLIGLIVATLVSVIIVGLILALFHFFVPVKANMDLSPIINATTTACRRVIV